MAQQTLSMKFIVELCEAKAMDFRTAAAREKPGSFSSAKNRDKAIEFEAKAQALDQLIDDLVTGKFAVSTPKPAAHIEALARTIDPKAFADFDAMVIRLRSEGRDDAYVISAAEAIFGEAIQNARELARVTVDNEDGPAAAEADAYRRGIRDAIAWHEHHAREADTLEASEHLPDKKIKFRKRAARHRLYAKAMQGAFDAQRAKAIHNQAEQTRIAAAQRSLFKDTH